MKPLRFAPLLAALCLALPAAAQERGATLTPFRSDADLTSPLKQADERADSLRRARAAANIPAVRPAPVCNGTFTVSRGTRDAARGPAVITGRVEDASHTALAGATVVIHPGTLRAETGANGEFRIDAPATVLTGGSSTARAARVGFGVVETGAASSR
jgi:hypothetical protein